MLIKLKTLLNQISKKFYTTIVVEGNTGSGKTTFLNHLLNRTDATKQIQLFNEPIDKWRNMRGIDLFQLLCDDIKRWGFAFHSYVILTTLELHKMPPINRDINFKIMERSLFAVRYCFVENLYLSGCLRREEYLVLDQWFRYIVDNENIGVDLIVYLRTTPEVVYERVLSRNRSGEQHISLDYLKRLHDLHEQWLITGQKFPIPAPLLIIDANGNANEVMNVCDQQIENILKMRHK